MTAHVETMAYANEVPWHGLGTNVKSNLSAEEMLKAAGLDWKVEKEKLITAKSKKTLADCFALVRDSDQSVLSVVGSTYKPVQNSEAMSFFKKFVDAGKMKMETAGSLKGGQYIWGLARIDQADFSVGTKNTDEVHSYLLMMSPHKYATAMVFQYTSVRVVCWNTISMALGASLRGRGHAFRMPHSVAFDEGVKALAEKALGLAVEQGREFSEVSKKLAKVKVTEKQSTDYFHKVLDVTEEQLAEIDKGDRKAPRALDKFQKALTFAPGHELVTAKGTAWGLVNAVTWVADHELGRTQDTRLSSAWLGSGQLLKQKAVEEAMVLAKIAA